MPTQSLSCVQFFVTLWTVAHQAPLSMGFPRQEYWSGVPFSTPGDLHRPRDQTSISCISRQVFLPPCLLGSSKILRLPPITFSISFFDGLLIDFSSTIVMKDLGLGRGHWSSATHRPSLRAPKRVLAGPVPSL